MNTGYLKLLVLFELCNKPKSGYDIMNRLNSILGKKPSPGSVYPLLKELEKSKFIRSIKSDRKKLYSLTTKGKNSMFKLIREKEEIVNKHLEIINLVEEITNHHFNNHHLINNIKTTIPKKGKNSFILNNSNLFFNHQAYKKFMIKNFDIWIRLKNTLTKLVLDENFIKKEEDIRKILIESEKKLRTLLSKEV